MHGDHTQGYEVMPSNVAFTASKLRLAFEEWDYTQPKPQAPAFKRWLKSHLALGRPIVWFPICKGDPHICYPGSCPNGGHADHVEVMYGLFSNHSLDDPNVYDDDYIVHTSDQDYLPYFRPIHSLQDSILMEGNCKHAGRGFGRNEMYPCFSEGVTYGLAVTGLAMSSNATTPLLPVSIETPGAVYEPNVRRGATAAKLRANVTVSGLTASREYVVFRYDSTAALPDGPPNGTGASHRTRFTAAGPTHTFEDASPFSSDGAVYYVAVPSSSATTDADRAGGPAVRVEEVQDVRSSA